jgi:DNA mismatch repair protein MutL
VPRIQQLDSHVADLIAAGEVVERPASVVKELVENAIDAGASVVAVEIRGGGMGLIRVSDNGCGIPPEELPTAFLRHATSKLRTERDLGAIGTLGFRGEALAAIAAVSRLDIVTRSAGARDGASLHLEGGVPGTVEPAGAPEGTTVFVRDLFFNTPARLKFVKKDSAETAAVNGLMQHLSLSHPDVSFKFVKDGAETMHTPGDGLLESAIYAALGRDFAATLLPVEGRGGDVQVTGFITRPLCARGSRAMQTFFVNGRFIKSQLLTAALEEGYRNQIMKGKFPGCVLAVTLPPSAVDVNVHPAKTQIKFARERDVFETVYHTIQDTLDGGGIPEPAGRQPAGPQQDFFKTMDAKAFRQQVSMDAHSRRDATAWNTEMPNSGQRLADSGASGPRYQTRAPTNLSGASADARETLPAERKNYPPAIPAMSRGAEKIPEQESMVPQTEAPWRIAGEVLRTYIICETEDEGLVLIDKHAAHERIHFDRMKAAKTPPMRQTLLEPIAAELSREDTALLLGSLPLLEAFGFACEDFGGGTMLVREIPAELDAADVVSTLEEFAEKLRTGRNPAENREALLHTMACKAAVKAGMNSDERELRVLADRVQSGEIRYCPHGRPVAVRISRRELEKLFRRT